MQHGFISRPERLQGDDRCCPEATVSSGPRRRSFTAKLQESADHQSRSTETRAWAFMRARTRPRPISGEGAGWGGGGGSVASSHGPSTVKVPLLPASLDVWSRYWMYFCTQAWPGSAQMDRPLLVWKLRSKKEKMRNGESAGKESVPPPQPLPRPPPAAASGITPIPTHSCHCS